MRYGSVCSGIEAATMAWHPLGWSPAFFAEIEKFPSQVLAHYYGSNMPGEEPSSNGVPNYGDISRYQEWPDATIDLLVGGTPCQAFSVAGLRKGLADPRGNLSLTYLGIVDRYRPRWCVWENVPGVLSLDEGRAFGSILGGLAELGYGFAYRVLDAQFVRVDGLGRAVPQRRRRVFVVGYLGDWRRAAAVLFEPESLSGNSAPRREAGQGVAPTISARPTGGGGLGTDFDLDGGQTAVSSTGSVPHCLNAGGMGRQDFETETLIAQGFGGNNCSGPIDTAASLAAHGGPAGRMDFASETFIVARSHEVADTLTSNGDAHSGFREAAGLVAHSLRAEGYDASEDGTGRGTPIIPIDMRQASRGEKLTNNRAQGSGGAPGHGVGEVGDIAYTLEARAEVQAVQEAWAVRRLMPIECERLQGFPDGFTDIMPGGKPTADGPRYKALGNSMAVNVMRWIGQRIEMVDRMAAEEFAEAAE